MRNFRFEIGSSQLNSVWSKKNCLQAETLVNGGETYKPVISRNKLGVFLKTLLKSIFGFAFLNYHHFKWTSHYHDQPGHQNKLKTIKYTFKGSRENFNFTSIFNITFQKMFFEEWLNWFYAFNPLTKWTHKLAPKESLQQIITFIGSLRITLIKYFLFCLPVLQCNSAF